jgi:hypothetical protein
MRMRQKLLLISGILIVILLTIIGFQQYMLYQTKQYSPEATVQYVSRDVRVEIDYNRPSKKGRVIFGGLVPYGEWWRTGANEPTTIDVNRDLVFNENDVLPIGKYSIVTIPHEDHWVLIFNRNIPSWGTEYDESQNALSVRMAVETLPQFVEQFLIDIVDNTESAELIMAWDKVKAKVSFRVL